MSRNLDERVVKLMAEVKSRRAKVAKLQKPSWLTSCSLELPGRDRLNIQVCTDLYHLSFAAGILMNIVQTTQAGEEALGLKLKSPIMWQNYPIDDWISDIRLRVQVIQIKSEQDKLAALEEKLKTVTSEDQRREMALDEIEKDLKV